MGCDIHAFLEVKEEENWIYKGKVFDLRNYGVFGFLANVRNYSYLPVISPPRGIPARCSEEVSAEIQKWVGESHSHSYLYLSELLSFPYYMIVWNRRVTRPSEIGFDGSATAIFEDEGEWGSLKWFLGKAFFEELDDIKVDYPDTDPKEIRIIFFFDN